MQDLEGQAIVVCQVLVSTSEGLVSNQTFERSWNTLVLKGFIYDDNERGKLGVPIVEIIEQGFEV